MGAHERLIEALQSEKRRLMDEASPIAAYARLARISCILERLWFRRLLNGYRHRCL
jgi:hypothetical protein